MCGGVVWGGDTDTWRALGVEGGTRAAYVKYIQRGPKGRLDYEKNPKRENRKIRTIENDFRWGY